MNNNLPPRVVMGRRGITLLELTVVITIILALLSITFVGAKAWKRGSDRAGCILTTRNVQLATRAYQNLYGYEYGGRPFAVDGTQDIAQHLYSKGYIDANLFSQAIGVGECPGGGIYSREVPDVFPALGQLYMVCSLSADEEHIPSSYAQW